MWFLTALGIIGLHTQFFFFAGRMLMRSTNQLDSYECWGKCKSRQVNTLCHSLLFFFFDLIASKPSQMHITLGNWDVKLKYTEVTGQEMKLWQKAAIQVKTVKMWAGDCEWKWEKELKDVQKNPALALKTDVFFSLSKSAYLLKGNPQAEDKQWRLLKKIRDSWELDLLWDCFTALSPTFPVCSSWMWASLCAKIAANSWMDTLPPSFPFANRTVSFIFVKCGWEMKKKRGFHYS